MWGTPDHHCINGSHIVLAGLQSFMCKILVCCPAKSSTQISPQQMQKTANLIYYSLMFNSVIWKENHKNVNFDRYEDKLSGNVVTVGRAAHCVHCVRDQVSYQWTCGDWGWGHHAACSLSPRSDLLQAGDGGTTNDQPCISVFSLAATRATVPSSFYPKCLAQPLQIIGSNQDIGIMEVLD